MQKVVDSVKWIDHRFEGIFPKSLKGPLFYVTFATFINNFVSFAIQIAAARALEVQEFGIFSLAISVVFLTEIIGEFGLNLATIRLFNKYNEDPKKQEILLGSVFIFKSGIFICLLLFSLPISQLFAYRLVGGENKNWTLFGVALVTGGLLFFWTYLQSLFQCYRQFNKLATYIILYSGLRLVTLVIIYTLIGGGSLTWLLSIYTIPTFILFVLGIIPIVKKLGVLSIIGSQASISILKEALGYSKWVALSGIAYTAMLYLVRFILAARTSIEEVGIFSAGMTFTIVFTNLNTAIRAVFFPKVTSFERREEIKRYLSRLSKIAPYYAMLALLGIACLGFLQWAVLGEKYRQALPVFLVTAVAFAISVFISTQTMLLHTMMRPDMEAKVDILSLIILTILTYFVASYFGAFGCAFLYSGVSMARAWSKVIIMNKILERSNVEKK